MIVVLKKISEKLVWHVLSFLPLLYVLLRKSKLTSVKNKGL